MQKYSFVLGAFLLSVVLASAAHSQNPAAQQPAAGGAPPAAGPGALPGPPTGAPTGAVDNKQVSYALGRQFAMNLKGYEIPVDVESLVAGVKDAVTGRSRNTRTSSWARRCGCSCSKCSRRRWPKRSNR